MQHPGKHLVTGESRESSDANSSQLCYAFSAQIGLVEANESGLVDRDTQVDLKHGLEHRPRYPLSVKVDATRNTSAYRLEEIFVAPGDDENLIVLQVSALQLPIEGGVQADPQRPGSASLLSSKKAISGSPCSSSTQSA